MKPARLKALASMILAILVGARLGVAQESSSVGDLARQLLKSVDNDDVASVRQLLDEGASIETRGQNGLTILGMAAEQGNVAMVKVLLDKGANIEARDNSDETALISSARNAHPEIVELLLQRTSDVQEKNQALFAAAGGGPVVIQMEVERKPNEPTSPVPRVAWESPWLKTVKLLLDAGAYIEAREPERSTPLLQAASRGQTDIFMLLLERGADIQASDKHGNTALIAAACECALATMNKIVILPCWRDH